MGGASVQEIKAHGARFRAFRPDPMPDRLFGVLRHQAFQLRLGVLMLKVGLSGAPKDAGEFRPGIRRAHVDDPHRLDAGARGSAPKRRGGSPLSTQRQNFFSAVSRRCW